ncbi:MAG: ribosome biogenesis GTPase Der [Bifidobacteriaceae bacterium]|jgi:GTP-binding protein|nr:ribosome biogenesis GTPase Der [Bifidobacteriaceae bacterium]
MTEQTPAGAPNDSRAASDPGADGIGDEPTAALRSALDEYQLEPEDLALLDGQGEPSGAEPVRSAGVLAIVGRPNVGKSTLVNRILGRRAAVVQDQPGVTRDRVAYPAHWAGKDFTVVDTGGWETALAGLGARVAEQAEVAVRLADAAVLVVDATVGATDADQQLVRMLRRVGKPVVLAANKVDGPSVEAEAARLWSLGLGEPHPVSALHGRGTGDMLDAAVAALAGAPSGPALLDPPEVRRVALIGRPNVGKSSLLNKLVGAERSVVDPLAGTTRDPVDELVHLGGRDWRFIDTAGIRRRVQRTQGADFYASLRTQGAIERAEVVVALIDSSQDVAEQDVRILQMASEAGRAVVIGLNKWDLMDPERRFYLERSVEQDLAPWSWAPRVNISALTGRRLDRLVGALDQALAGWGRRVSTGRLNSFLGQLVAARPHPLRSGKQPRILFATQASTEPPRFVIFATGFLEAPYRRFIERSLRESFDFTGTPIQISVRVRERRRR